MNLFDLTGEVAVVIGGTGALGGAVAEGMAAAGARHIRLGTEAAKHQLLVRLSADVTVPGEALGLRRLALYRRTLGWLGGSLEREQDVPTTFLLRLPELGQGVRLPGAGFAQKINFGRPSV